MTRNVLVLGASYGSLLATKLLMAGHSAHLICQPHEADLINEEGTIVRLRPKGRSELLEVFSRDLPGQLRASGPSEVDPADFDLIVLAMQEPQYGSTGVRELMAAIARSRVPCLAIMNMPPLPFLARIPGLPLDACRAAYTDPTVWDGFEPTLMTMCSADPQAFRPPADKLNTLQVGLPTNFKAASFEAEAHTSLLRGLEDDIEAARLVDSGGPVEIPVKLKVHDSMFIPMAKWPMLLTGNFRCILNDSVRSIRESVHSNLEASRSIYKWVTELCESFGAPTTDFVPFEKYAAAAESLTNPSSAARAVQAGAKKIERPDRLVMTLAAHKGMSSDVVNEVVATVDARLEANRRG